MTDKKIEAVFSVMPQKCRSIFRVIAKIVCCALNHYVKNEYVVQYKCSVFAKFFQLNYD